MSSDPRTQTVQAPDGRQLEVVTAGPEDGRCYLFHSGTPSAAGAYPPLVAELDQAQHAPRHLLAPRVRSVVGDGRPGGG